MALQTGFEIISNKLITFHFKYETLKRVLTLKKVRRKQPERQFYFKSMSLRWLHSLHASTLISLHIFAYDVYMAAQCSFSQHVSFHFYSGSILTVIVNYFKWLIQLTQILL